MSLLSPYAFTGSLTWSSGIGTTLGDPYTAAEEEKTNLRMPCFRRVSSIITPQATLASKKGPGLITDSEISAFAAKWNTTSNFLWVSTLSSASRSPTSNRWTTAGWGTASGCPADKSSTSSTENPLDKSWAQQTEPT